MWLLAALVASSLLQAQDAREALRKLQMAEIAISRLYVDSVNENSLVEEAII